MEINLGGDLCNLRIPQFYSNFERLLLFVQGKSALSHILKDKFQKALHKINFFE